MAPMPEPLWSDAAASRLDAIREQGRWRATAPIAGSSAHTAGHDGRPLVNFASNDYLGLAAHPAVVAAAVAATGRGFGAGSARLITGDRVEHGRLEAELADWKGAEAALLFPTGYAANLGVLTAVARLRTGAATIFSDELNHASIIDGARLASAEVSVFPHCDVATLAAGLDGRARGSGIVVSDTVFSMDGDLGDTAGLAAVAGDHGALLVLDDAHVVFPSDDAVAATGDVMRIGTLSKALGSLGGYVVGDRVWIDYLRNVARPFIFTTACPPAVAAAASAALWVVRSDEGGELIAHLRSLVDRLVPGHPSPIVPLVVGEADAAVAAAAALRRKGLLVPAIRPPTVAPGSSRLRITVSAAHTHDDVDRLLETLDSVNLSW